MNRHVARLRSLQRWSHHPRHKPRKKLLLPSCEPLELRQLLSNVDWISTSSGSWDVGSNWSTGKVPGSGDDVVINVSGANPTVTISSGSQSVQSVTADDPLSISGGSLTVAANSTISGGLSMTGGSLTANGSGTSLTVTGTTTVSGASLYAENGATLTLSSMASYTNPDASDDTYFEATGAGAVLDLPFLTSLGQAQGYLYIDASQGGQTLLPALNSINSTSQTVEYVQVDADGSGSLVNLSALTTFVGSGSSSLTVTDGGTVLDPSLTTLSVDVTLDGTGTIATGQWTSLTDSGLTITGGSYTFNLTDIDGTGLHVQAGASLTLPDVVSYTNPPGDGSSDFEAIGAGAVLDLPFLTSLGQVQGYLYIDASQGGQTLLPALNSINSTSQTVEYVQVDADGSGSLVNLSALTTFVGSGSSSLTVTDGGTVLDPSLTTLSVDVTLDGTGTIATGQWTSLTDSGLTITGGSYTFNLTDIDGTGLHVQAGASLTLPDVVSYTNPPGDGSSDFEAIGAGAVLDLPFLTSLGQVQGYLYIDASQGGQTLLPALNSINSTSQTVEYVQVDADGSGSLVNLSALTTFVGSGSSSLTVTDGGTVLDPSLTTLSVDVTLDGTGTIATGQWTSLTDSGLTITGGSYTFNLTDIDGTGLHVQAGASLTLPDVVSYTNPPGDGSSDFEAIGAGAVLDLPFLTSLGQVQGYLYIDASQGGQTLLPALNSINSTSQTVEYVQVDADGSGSLINLSALTTFVGSGSSSLTVTGGGTVLDPSLTTLSVDVTLDGTGTIAASQWVSLRDSGLTITGGSYTFNLTDINGTGLHVQAGASLALPDVVSYTNPPGDGNSYFDAIGAGAVLELPALTTLGQVQGYLYIEASQGGQTLLPALSSIKSTSQALEYVQVDADGAGSKIDLSGLTSYTSPSGSLAVTNSATVLDPELTSLNGVSVTLDGTGTLATGQWASLTAGSIAITGGAYTLTSLTDIGLTSLQLSGGATLSLPALAQGELPLSNGQGVSIQGKLVSMPASGTSGGTINVPATQGLTIVLQNSGTLTGNTTLNVGQGTTVDLTGGIFIGGAIFNVAAGAAVNLTGGGSPTYSGTLTGTGGGIVELGSGRLYIGTGGVTLNFAGSTFQWTGGKMEAGNGNLTNLGTMTITAPVDFYNDGVLSNFGTIIQTGTGNLQLGTDGTYPATLMNEAGASYLLEGDGGLSELSNSGSAPGQTSLDNAGNILKTAGTGTSYFTVLGSITNTGTIEADSGTIALDPTLGISQLTGNSLSAGTWRPRTAPPCNCQPGRTSPRTLEICCSAAAGRPSRGFPVWARTAAA